MDAVSYFRELNLYLLKVRLPIFASETYTPTFLALYKPQSSMADQNVLLRAAGPQLPVANNIAGSTAAVVHTPNTVDDVRNSMGHQKDFEIPKQQEVCDDRPKAIFLV